MITYKFYLDNRTLDTVTNKASLKIRIFNNGKKAEIGLGVQLSQQVLDDALSKNPPAAVKRIASFISMRKLEIDKVIMSLLDEGKGNTDVKEISRIVKQVLKVEKEEDNSFVGWFNRFIDTKDNPGTKGVYRHTLSRLGAYYPQLDGLKFEDITINWLENFDAFLAKTAKAKNARNIHFRNIRAVFNYAIDNSVTSFYPFRRFKIRPEATRKRSLQVEELRELFDYPVEPYAEIYRDMFKLIFMLIGINTVDLHRLSSITKDGRIEYKRAKTGRLYSVKVEPEAMEIIEKYKGANGLLCIADRWTDNRNFTHQCNKALQFIGAAKNKGGRLAGGAPKKNKKDEKSEGAWPELTTYWARHSWATIAYSLGVSKDIIAQALGHADGHDTTNIYINEDIVKVDEANRKVLDWVLYGKK